jgi:hypothetical protein
LNSSGSFIFGISPGAGYPVRSAILCNSTSCDTVLRRKKAIAAFAGLLSGKTGKSLLDVKMSPVLKCPAGGFFQVNPVPPEITN